MPDDEVELVRFVKRQPCFAGAGTYQLRKLLHALPHVTTFRHAVDVGAHVGTWSRVLARMFPRVTAFEPIDEVADCFVENLRGSDAAIVLHRLALGAKTGAALMNINDANRMLTQVGKEGRRVEMALLDSFALTDVDFLKIDVEGYERHVLLGAEQTIRRCKPVIVIEQKVNKKAWPLLKAWGGKEKWNINGDLCIVMS